MLWSCVDWSKIHKWRTAPVSLGTSALKRGGWEYHRLLTFRLYYHQFMSDNKACSRGFTACAAILVVQNSEVGVPNQSCGSWTLFYVNAFFYTCAGHVCENALQGQETNNVHETVTIATVHWDKAITSAFRRAGIGGWKDWTNLKILEFSKLSDLYRMREVDKNYYGQGD